MASSGRRAAIHQFDLPEDIHPEQIGTGLLIQSDHADALPVIGELLLWKTAMNRLLLLFCIFLAHGFVQAETLAVGPDMNAYYFDADPEHWAEIFQRSGRKVYNRRFEVVEALDIGPGMRTADEKQVR